MDSYLSAWECCSVLFYLSLKQEVIYFTRMTTSLTPFDRVLEEKVGFGRYQLITYFFMGMTQFADGSEIVSLSILVPILKNEWGISTDQEGLLGSILFFGIFFGSLCSGLISDRFGRRTALLYGTIIQFVFGVISVFIRNIALFIFVRGLFGLMIGFTVPLAPSMGSELTPIKLRGRGVVAINCFFSLGKIYGVIVALFCLDNLREGNWQAMLIWSAVPSLIVFFGALNFLKESPRFLVSQKKVREGVEILNYISKFNNGSNAPQVTEKEIEEIETWAHQTFELVSNSVSLRETLRALFSPQMKKVSGILWVMWFSLNFTFFGMVFILPIILSEIEENQGAKASSAGLWDLLITLLGELPSSAIAWIIIERPKFGRKNTILYSQIMGTILFGISFLSPGSLMVATWTVARAFLKLSFAIIYPFTIELYPTSFRTSGFGFSSGFGRLGNSLGPYLLLELTKIGITFPALGFSIACFIMSIAVYNLPYDTTGRVLDGMEGKNDPTQKLIELEEADTDDKKVLKQQR